MTIDSKNHVSFLSFGNDKKYTALVPEEVLNLLEEDMTKFCEFNELVNKPYIVFTPNDADDFILLDAQENIKINFTNIVIVVHNIGVDCIFTLADNSNIIFPIFEIEKRNKICIKNIFRKKIKQEEKDNIFIEYEPTFDFFIGTERFEKCKFSIMLEKKLSNDLLIFFNNYKKIWHDFSFKRYKNLVIYFNRFDIEDGILFDIKNCEVSKFYLNIIQERLFFILNYADKPKLFINDIFFTTARNNKMFFVNIFGKNTSFIEEENCIKFDKMLLEF